jgi:hypothetical protein
VERKTRWVSRGESSLWSARNPHPVRHQMGRAGPVTGLIQLIPAKG